MTSFAYKFLILEHRLSSISPLLLLILRKNIFTHALEIIWKMNLDSHMTASADSLSGLFTKKSLLYSKKNCQVIFITTFPVLT